VVLGVVREKRTTQVSMRDNMEKAEHITLKIVIHSNSLQTGSRPDTRRFSS